MKKEMAEELKAQGLNFEPSNFYQKFEDISSIFSEIETKKDLETEIDAYFCLMNAKVSTKREGQVGAMKIILGGNDKMFFNLFLEAFKQRPDLIPIVKSALEDAEEALCENPLHKLFEFLDHLQEQSKPRRKTWQERMDEMQKKQRPNHS